MKKSFLFSFTLLLALAGGATVAAAQEARLRPAGEFTLPNTPDGNSPLFWRNDRLHIFTSIGGPPELSVYDPELKEWIVEAVDLTSLRGKGVWFEAAWADDDGTVLAWYHHEPGGLYPDSRLTAPMIGAAVSFDGGYTMHDLGIVLASGDDNDPGAQNGFFTGGHGDFSVVLDRDRQHFYFFFTNYGGDPGNQGVAMARLAFADRFEPVGKVHKFHNGQWNEPGVGGRITALFPAARAWNHPDPDSFWGPAVHWNTHLNSFVMLLNRAEGEPGWAQEGIYVSFATDLNRPESWLRPRQIMERAEVPGYRSFYPQVLGMDPGGTDTLAGKTARFFINGTSSWEIDFNPGVDPTQPPDRRIPPPDRRIQP